MKINCFFNNIGFSSKIYFWEKLQKKVSGNSRGEEDSNILGIHRHGFFLNCGNWVGKWRDFPGKQEKMAGMEEEHGGR
jgi:hypothetical protein